MLYETIGSPGPIRLWVGGRKEAYFAKYCAVEGRTSDERPIDSGPVRWVKEKGRAGW